MKSTFTLKERAKVFLLTMFLLIASIKTFAYNCTLDGVCYKILSYQYSTCEVSGYTELTNSDLIIPASINNYTVKSIGEGAFRNCRKVTSIIIPEGVTEIRKSAFEDCSGMTSINIPESVTKIGESAFEDCSGMTSINIPEGVTEIGISTFLL